MALIVYPESPKETPFVPHQVLVPALTPEQSQAIVIFQSVLLEKEGIQSENNYLRTLVLKAHNSLITKHLKDLFRVAELDGGLKRSITEVLQNKEIEDAAKPHLIVKIISDVLDNETKSLSQDEEFDAVILPTEPKKELREAFNNYRQVLKHYGECLFPELTPKQVEKALSEFSEALIKNPKKLQEVKESNHVAWAIIGGAGAVAGLSIYGIHLAFQSALKTIETACKVVETAVAVIVGIPTAAYTIYTLVSTIRRENSSSKTP